MLLPPPLQHSARDSASGDNAGSVDECDLDDDWVVLRPEDWWHTPYAAPTVSWAFPQSTRTQLLPSSLKKKHLHYHGSLFRPVDIENAGVCCELCKETRDILCPCSAEEGNRDVELRKDLVGVQSVLEVLDRYESDVGFSAVHQDQEEDNVLALARRVALLSGRDDPIAAHGPSAQEAWLDETSRLFAGVLTRLSDDAFAAALDTGDIPPDTVPSILDLDLDLRPSSPSPTSSASSSSSLSTSTTFRQTDHGTDLTDEEPDVADHSVASLDSDLLPVTPKGPIAPTNIACCSSDERDDEPDPNSPRPTPSAISNLFRPMSPGRLAAQLDLHLPKGKSRSDSERTGSVLPLRKDEHGFYVVDSPAAKAGALPPFLTQIQTKKPASRTRVIVDGLRAGDGRGLSVSQAQAKAKDGSEKEKPPLTREAVATSVRLSFQKGSDGWIDMAPQASSTRTRRRGTHRRSPSNGVTPGSVGTFTFPPPPVPGPGPAPPYHMHPPFAYPPMAMGIPGMGMMHPPAPGYAAPGGMPYPAFPYNGGGRW